MNVIPVVAALILRDGCVLIARRKQGKTNGGLWEFPGGKIEKGESPEAALIRELKEELGIHLTIQGHFHSSTYSYPNFSVRLIAFTASTKEDSVISTDHDLIEWVSPEQIFKYDLAPADVEVAKKWAKMHVV